MNHVFMVEWLKQTSLLMNEKKEYLSTLGNREGISEFGNSMSSGFLVAYQAAAENDERFIGKQLYKAGKAMLKSDSNIIVKMVATGFMEAGKAARGKNELQPVELINVLYAFEKGVTKVGRGKPVEKEFLNSFHPGVIRLKEALQIMDNIDDAFVEAAVAAEKGCNNSCIEKEDLEKNKKREIAVSSVVGMYLICTLEQAMKGILI